MSEEAEANSEAWHFKRSWKWKQKIFYCFHIPDLYKITIVSKFSQVEHLQQRTLEFQRKSTLLRQFSLSPCAGVGKNRFRTQDRRLSIKDARIKSEKLTASACSKKNPKYIFPPESAVVRIWRTHPSTFSAKSSHWTAPWQRASFMDKDILDKDKLKDMI